MIRCTGTIIWYSEYCEIMWKPYSFKCYCTQK